MLNRPYTKFDYSSSLAAGQQEFEGALEELWNLFRQAPTVGSLLDPAGVDRSLFRTDYEAVEQLLASAIAKEDSEVEQRELSVAARGLNFARKLLAAKYELVITNVPYLARGKQDARMQKFGDREFPDAKKELATMFVARIDRWLGANGVQAVVAQQYWLFLTSYGDFRRRFLRAHTWRLWCRLGAGAFEAIRGEVVNVALTVLSTERPRDKWRMVGIDVSTPRGRRPIRPRDKARLLRSGIAPPVLALQCDQLLNPGSRVLMRPFPGVPLLRAVGYGHQGIATADYKCFGRKFWELPELGSSWEFQQSTVRESSDFGGREHVLHWEGGEGRLQRGEGVRIQGRGAWNREGVAISQMGALPVTRYTGEYFDNNVAVLTVDDQRSLPAVWCFCAARDYAAGIGEIDQAPKVTNANLVEVPFDLSYWEDVARKEYSNGLPEPHTDDPTQWLFHGHPCGSVVWNDETKWTGQGPLRANASVLHVAVARLLGYRWPAELDPGMRLAAESREWVEQCRELQDFADADGIVCLQAVAGELPAADRLRRLLSAAYGEEWSDGKEGQLLAAANGKRPPKSLSEWLRDRFFAEHCRLFHNRPFVWHVWDGRRDGFHALVNCHRLCGPADEGRRTLEALAYRHLGEWIDRQRMAQSQGEEGADSRLASALDLERQLKLILKGEPPYDLFSRWRPLHEQPVGWAPHVDDGVRVNIRPFMRAELQSGGRKGACILRFRPKITWKKDVGKEPRTLRAREDFPWFYSCPGQGFEADRTDYEAAPEAEYDGARWNDLHYTRAVKEAARRRAGTEDST